MKNINKFYILLISIFISCENRDSSRIIEQVEHEIYQNYEVNFSTGLGPDLDKHPLNIYEKVEQYFIFTGIMKSNSKEDYATMFRNYVWTDSIPDLSCLYHYVPESGYLFLPSNIHANFLNYEKALSNNIDYIPNTSNLLEVQTAMNQLIDGINLKYTDENLMRSYFEALNEQDFKSKIIYRAPLIAIAHANFVDKAQ